MKAIVCEMCNDNDVVKQDGLYICQNCGTKYTTEDAKKLMVDISGSSVKVDETEKVERYRKLAREARGMGNIQKAGEYYNQLVVLCPDDWEAVFFSVYCTSASCVLAQLCVAASNVGNATKLAAVKIKDIPVGERGDAGNQIAKHVLLLSEAFIKTATDHYNKFSNVNGAWGELNNRKQAVRQMLIDTADGLAICDEKTSAIELLTNVFHNHSKDDNRYEIAKRMNSLKSGSGTALMEARLDELQGANKSTGKSNLIGWGITAVSLVGAFLIGTDSAMYYVLVIVGAISLLVNLMMLGVGKSNKKDAVKMERDIAELKKQ